MPGGKTEATLAGEHGIRLVGDLLRRAKGRMALLLVTGLSSRLTTPNASSEAPSA